ncbi:TerD family protein [Streptomyces xanthii]|uniref:TerD family protein n=1 Tax=Streptomyces xanthii TaxID=2768069 RepID=A0A7H1B3W6_9ACTN|nr:TerD family protein [Streptomyces xanthii]QNS03421.1 TerD family protein [Streptomyces xanthii]
MALLSSRPKWPTLPEYFHDWALVDVETSGLRPGRDRVLSLAILTLDAHGNRTGEFSTLLDPGCDPGPVHVHGLTSARLAGAPTFEDIAPEVGALLGGRVLVAHNAQFDYDFLAHEFARVRSWVPVGRRLCTLALNRLVGPETPDLKLGTLAEHYGVRQLKAHDAQDDVRVLSGILRGSLAAAEQLGLALPLLECPPRQDYKPYVPKTPCPYRNPGRLTPGGPLVQGMKIAITGETRLSREELVARSVAAGLNVTTSVSGQTGVVVTNDPGAGSAKLRRAVTEGVPLVDEAAYLRLLESVRPGQTKGTARQRPAERPPAAERAAEPEPAPEVPAQRTAAPGRPDAPTDRPLTGRRVLVLGGTHDEAAEARVLAVALGASAAVNLSASVTDVVVLPGGEADRRMRRVTALGLPVHDTAWLLAPTPAPEPATGSRPDPAPDTSAVLVRGAVIDLADTGTPWTVSASWRQQTASDVDVVAFAIDAQEQVAGDEDFVFYGAPEHPDGTVRLATDGPTEQSVTADLDRLPLEVRRVVIAAALDGAATFSDVGAIEITATRGIGAAPTARATLDAATSERTMILAEMYRRGEAWRLRAVGQGYDHGLADMARGYGVDVAE